MRLWCIVCLFFFGFLTPVTLHMAVDNWNRGWWLYWVMNIQTVACSLLIIWKAAERLWRK
jgi:hypothetical protein